MLPFIMCVLLWSILGVSGDCDIVDSYLDKQLATIQNKYVAYLNSTDTLDHNECTQNCCQLGRIILKAENVYDISVVQGRGLLHK